ncbi:MAG: DUF58 domain-containing protein [Verrucomicrobia bacterium]|nr:DUF58 domain-containing protein [Verrucomicrobiota bacterium]
MFASFPYRCFRFFAAAKEWFARRFTRNGLLLLAGLGFSAVLGLDTNQTVTYQIFTFLFAALMLAVAGSRFQRAPFAAQRTLPRFGSAGEPLAYPVLIENQTSRLQEGLALFEDLADPRPTWEEFIATPEPEERRRNWFDRAFGYYRWRWLLRRKQCGVFQEQPLPAMPAGGHVEMRVEITPARRGRLQFRGMTLARADPLGIFRSLTLRKAEGSVLILPKRYPLPAVAMPGTMRYQQGGVALASSVGESEEFISLRDYRPGDPLRHIHWRSWAKIGKPIVKEFEDEFFVRHALILDTFLDANGNGDLFEEAVSVAASFVCAVQTQESLLDLMFVGPDAYCFTMGRGLGHADRMLEILASVTPCRNKPFVSLHQAVIQHARAVSGCVCVFLAWDDARQELVRQLRALDIPMLVLVLTETGKAQWLDAGPLKDQVDRFHPLEVGNVGEGLARL